MDNLLVMRKLALYILSLFLFFCSHKEEFSTRGYIGDDFIEVTAVGASPKNETLSEAELKRIAAETAYYLAAGKMAAALSGIKIDGVFTMRDLGHTSAYIKEKLSAYLVGIEEKENRYRKLPDGSWEATSTIRIEKNKSLEFLRDISEERILPEITVEYSSIIFDLSEFRDGINILSVYRIYDESGILVMSPNNMRNAVLRQGGYFTIYPGIDGLLKRRDKIGENPLVLKAIKVDNDKKAVIIDKDLAEDIRKYFTLFREGKVFFVL